MTRHFGILTRDFIEQADCSPISRPCAGDGKALKQHQIRTAEPVSGDLIVGYDNVSTLGRCPIRLMFERETAGRTSHCRRFTTSSFRHLRFNARSVPVFIRYFTIDAIPDFSLGSFLPAPG